MKPLPSSWVEVLPGVFVHKDDPRMAYIAETMLRIRAEGNTDDHHNH